MVIQCTTALNQSGIATGLTAIGIIDRDSYSDALLDALPSGVFVLPVHEVESLFCLPDMVAAVADHLGRPFDPDSYLLDMKASTTDAERHKLILERWKRRLEPQLEGLLSAVRTRTDSIDVIGASVPDLFDRANWSFSPEGILAEERALVEE